MKIELNDLYLIDNIALSIMSSKLNHTNFTLTHEQIETLAVSAYRYAVIVHEVRENFKKEHSIVNEICVKEEVTNDLLDVVENMRTLINAIKEASTVKNDIATNETLENNKVAPIESDDIVKPKRGRPKASAPTNDEPKVKRGRKPKTVLKINRILDKRP